MRLQKTLPMTYHITLRSFIKSNNHISKLVNYSNTADVFDNVVIKGGVSYFIHDNTHEGKVLFTNYMNGQRLTQ